MLVNEAINRKFKTSIHLMASLTSCIVLPYALNDIAINYAKNLLYEMPFDLQFKFDTQKRRIGKDS